MTKQPGDWIQESRIADCPICGSDSVGVRRIDGETESRRCDEGHEFEAQAWEVSKPSDATRFDVQ